MKVKIVYLVTEPTSSTDSTPHFTLYTREAAVRMMEHRHSYVCKEEALEDFKAVHWAQEVELHDV